MLSKFSNFKLQISGLVLANIFFFISCQSQAVPSAEPSTSVPIPIITPTTKATATAVSAAPSATHSERPFALGSEIVRERDGMVQVYVPAGIFMMGSPASFETADANEFPQHPVELTAFWIDQTEVTVAQFRIFIEATGHETTAELQGTGYVFDGSWRLQPGVSWEYPTGPDATASDNHPVTQVSWHDALAYCEWVGGALPSEAQWEYAARGSDGFIYPWGNEFDSTKLNYCDTNCSQSWKDETVDDGYALTSPVGSFPDGRSWVGTFDMAGNVWEWVNDWQGPYPADLQHNPVGAASGRSKVLRGGGWVGDENSVRTARRGGNSPNSRGIPDGFRCVSSLTNQ